METLEYLRGFKIFGYAIFDLVVSLGGIYLLSGNLTKLFKKINIDIPKINWLFLTLPIGIIFHLIFGNMTPMTKDLFNLNGFYTIKIIFIILIFLGFRNIKILRKK